MPDNKLQKKKNTYISELTCTFHLWSWCWKYKICRYVTHLPDHASLGSILSCHKPLRLVDTSFL